MRILARLGLIALVIAAASALWWLDTLREREPEPVVDPEARHEPDYYFDEFRLRAHERTGPPRYVLEGERLVHFADDGTAEVTQPRLTYGVGEASPWRVTGRRGVLGPDGDVVDLYQDVVMQREPGDRPPVTLRTSHATVYTAAGRAETERPVTVVSPGWRVRAIGMTARFNAGLIELHQEARGRYDPTITR